jgi:hypothetical protein
MMNHLKVRTLFSVPLSFVFEHAAGYVKTLEKSTCPLSTMQEVFEPYTQNDKTGERRLEAMLTVVRGSVRDPGSQEALFIGDWWGAW